MFSTLVQSLYHYYSFVMTYLQKRKDPFTHDNLRSSSREAQICASEGENSSENIVIDLPLYPPIWKKAFALGENVLFTRTPEVELLCRRIEQDPTFAQKLAQNKRLSQSKQDAVSVSEEEYHEQDIEDFVELREICL